MTVSYGPESASKDHRSSVATDWSKALQDWKQVITEPNEVAVFSSLDDPEWDWRTVEGIRRDTKLSAEEIKAVLRKYSPLIRASESSKYGLVYQLRNRTTQTTDPLIDRALDFISMGKRRKTA